MCYWCFQIMTNYSYTRIKMKFKLIVLILIITFFSSCTKKEPIQIESVDYHDVVDKVTEIMVHDIFSPPLASRVYAYPSIAAYEALNQNNSTYASLATQLNGLEKISINKENDNINLKLASLIAYLDVAKELVFSTETLTAYRDSLYVDWDTKNTEEFINAKTYALDISGQIITWMKSDNYSETRTMPDYNVYTDNPSQWIPTPPSYMKGIEPHWNKLRPFILDSASQFKPEKHPDFSLEKDSHFHKELVEVYTTINDIREKGNESNEMQIARFWDCNPYVAVNKGHFMFAEKKITPGAHWIGICKIACIDTKADFEKTVYAYTKTSIAIADAFISCWDEKYRSNLVRPETLINTYIDKDWAPILQTPPFPEYTSGHSVVSGASSRVLTEIFGDNFSFEDTTELPYGLPVRNFDSFTNAAKEAAISRLYGGIHYISAVNLGLNQGFSVGEFVNSEISFIK